MTDYKEFAKQMRENAVKNEQGNIVCSPELWEKIASVIEQAIVPPCKVGDRVYSINIGDKKILKIWIEPNGDRITQIKINRGGYHFKCWWGYFHLSDIGKTVFLTKEEAEEKLKELGK